LAGAGDLDIHVICDLDYDCDCFIMETMGFIFYVYFILFLLHFLVYFLYSIYCNVFLYKYYNLAV
jgi:hypothetical protein